jgi:predicted nucleotidyltransferase
MPAEQTIPGVDDKIVGEVVRRLIDLYHPERIYLFGSAARGDANGDSDYDFMVVVPDDIPVSLRRTERAYVAMAGVDASVDVLVWTKAYFDERLQLRASLPSTILREGRLIYGR